MKQQPLSENPPSDKNDTNSLATIYFRLRDGKKDIKAASELTINPNHWSSEKQGYKDRVALVHEEKETGTEQRSTEHHQPDKSRVHTGS